MRVVAGAWGGRTLKAPRGDRVRPTSDRVREALFNILGELEEARVLDVCGGTGAIALEALSRGAASAVVVEKDRAALEAIHANKAALGADRLTVVARDLRLALPALTGEFDLIFADPPWAEVPLLAPIVLAAARERLADGGTVVIEHAARAPAPPAPAPLVLERTREYGDTALSFYARGPA